MWPPPYVAERPRAVQVIQIAVVPVIFGLICGFLLTSSAELYLILQALGIAGGFLAGFEHRTNRGGALRGVVGGTLFGLSTLIGHELRGEGIDHELIPSPGILLLAITTGLGVLLGWLGAYLRNRRSA